MSHERRQQLERACGSDGCVEDTWLSQITAPDRWQGEERATNLYEYEIHEAARNQPDEDGCSGAKHSFRKGWCVFYWQNV